MRKRKITSVILATVLTMGSLGSTNVWAEEFFSAESAAESNESETTWALQEEADTQEESAVVQGSDFAEEALGFDDGSADDSSTDWNVQGESEENAFSSEEDEELVLDEEAATDPLTLANNTYSTAKNISVNTIYSSNLTSYNDELWLKFTLSSPGSISFSFRHDYIDSSATYWYAKIYESDGSSELASYSFAGNTVSYAQNRFGVKSGTYYVKINSSNFSNVNFKFRINYTEAGNWEKERNDTYENASVLNSNTWFYGSLQNRSDVDWYQLSVTKPGTLSIDFSHNYVESSSNYWKVELYDFLFQKLESYTVKGNETSFSGVKAGVSGSTWGPYYVKVSTVNYSDIPYGIKLNYAASDVWEKEGNNDYSSANKIELETLYSGSLQMQDDVDWFKFTVPAAGNYRFLFEHEYVESSSEYWRARIYDSGFQELATYNYKGNVNSLENKLNLDKTGTYYIKIEKRNYSDNIYSIKMSQNWQSTAYGTLPADALYYNGHYYYVYDLGSRWKEAKAYCESLGGYLATITSQAENDAVYAYLKKMGYESAYFGFTDEAGEGKWKWVTGETTSYTNWSPGEPNNGYSGENYAMFYYKYPTGKWNDGDFGGSTQGNCRAFICEWGPYSVHTHSYQYSVTPATVSKEGSISQKCSCGDEKNKTTIYCPSKAIFSKSSYTYTGKAQKPAFTLYDSKMNVIDSSNYTVTYESSPKSIGKHTIYLKFKNHYSGTATSSYVINPKGTSIKTLKGYSRAISVKWAKVKTCTGYQIQYSTSKKFTNAYNYSVSSKSKISATIKYLKGKTRYYVRVRAYKTVGSEKYYSAWSKTKSVRTKR